MSQQAVVPEPLLSRQTKSNIELITFLYGSLIVRLAKDIKDNEKLNKKIEEIGYEIGKRLIDDLIDDSGHKKLDTSNKKLLQILVEDTLSNYLGIVPKFTPISDKEFSVIFDVNPLCFYVELPEDLNNLCYPIIICGILRGVLEISGFEVTCDFVKDCLKGDEKNEIKIVKIKDIEERYIDDEE